MASQLKNSICCFMEKVSLCAMKVLLLLFVTTWNENGAHAVQGCGSLVNNSLRSPGYPNDYPSKTDCVYLVPIPPGRTMKMFFEDFDVEDSSSCYYDYLKISNEHGYIFGVYCGERTGEAVLVTGDNAVITFHSDYMGQKRGFLISFSTFPHVPPNISLPDAAVVRTLPGYRVTFPVTGSPPIHTAIIRNSTVLVNTTNTAGIRIFEEGNYTCVATSNYGTDVKEFTASFSHCGPRCSYEWQDYLGNILSCTNVPSPMDVIYCAPTMTEKLTLKSNAIAILPKGVFETLSKLGSLYLQSNAITQLPEGVFTNLKNLRSLYLQSNVISFLPDAVFANLTNLRKLSLSSNAITRLPEKLFARLTLLRELYLSSNALKFLPPGVFANLRSLRRMNLSSNSIRNFSDGVFDNLRRLHWLQLSSNEITFLPERIFATQKGLQMLFLSSNDIQSLPAKLFMNTSSLFYLELSFNKIQHLPHELFCCTGRLSHLILQNNRIPLISNETFTIATGLQYLFLSANQLKTIPFRAFFYLHQVNIIMLSDNPLRTIEPEAFKLGRLSLKMNPLNSDSKAIKLRRGSNEEFASALLASGFMRIFDNRTRIDTYLPCPLGTFYNSSSEGRQGCIECPPGGFYSDTLGRVAQECKRCPNGSFVPYELTPGKSVLDCKACPQDVRVAHRMGYSSRSHSPI
ncbi:uncharacterized protein LOC144637130 [Oculina patagonica]